MVGDQGALSRAVGVWLPDANLARLRSVRSHAYFVVFDFTMLRIAQQPRMHEAQVGYVKKVFDHPWTFRAKEIRPRQHQAEPGVVTIRKVGKVAQRFSHADPDNAVTLPCLVSLRTCLQWGWLACLRRDMHTLAARVVFPGMIRTHQAIAAQSAQRKLGATVDAKIAPTVDALR